MMREAEALTFQDDFENSIDSMTTAGGMRVDTITSCKDKHVQAAVTVTRANGQSISFEADDNVRINEREDGSLSITFARTGEIRVYAADGSMNAEQGEPLALGHQWNGTDGDDVFLALRTGTQINAGAGNDSILLLTGTRSINGGDGDDLIMGGRAINTTSMSVFGGAGNDTLCGANQSFDRFDMGDGDNVITINRLLRSGYVGNGNNIITINNIGTMDNTDSGRLIVGNGNNTIRIIDAGNSTITVGI
jgi:hypothetical protein